MLSATISASPTPSRYFTSARNELPYAAAGADGGRDVALPVGHDARHRVLEAFRRGHRHAGVTRVARLAPRITGFERGGRRVIAAPPDQHLLLAEFRRHLRLVEALQGAVVALVQAPALVLRQPHLVEPFERDPQRADRALQHR